MISGLILAISMEDHTITLVFFNRNYLNSIFTCGCRLKLIRRVHSGWCGFTLNDSGSSSALLSRLFDSVGVSESGLPPNFDCYWSTIFFFLIHLREFIRFYLGCFLHPVQSLSGYYNNCSGHHLVTLYIGNSEWCGILQQLMMGGRVIGEELSTQKCVFYEINVKSYVC